MALLFVVILIMRTSVSLPFTVSSISSLTACVGYTKEQSLRGIVDWFDFWLSQ